MPPSRNQKNNGQDRRDRRSDPLGGRPEHTSATDDSTQQQFEGLSLAQRVSQPPQSRSSSRSSTPRGDRRGRGRGGHSGVGGRGGHSSNRPSSSTRWNQSQPEPETVYKHTNTALMTRVCAADGVFATKLTPTGLGGGHGNNWFADTPDKGYWIRSELGTGVDAMLQRLKRDNPEATGFNITASCIFPDKFEAIDRDHTQRIVMNNDFRDKDNKPSGLFGRDIMAPSERKPVAAGNCEICGSDKHVLSDCVERGYKGFVSGCSICNSRSHNVDSCTHFRAMSLLEKVQTLVQKRANRPPMKTSTPWWRYLHSFCSGEEFVPDVVVDFPWSKPFCESFGWKGMKKIQQDFDAKGDKYKFDRDPKLSTFRQVSDTYWESSGLPWPEVLDNLVVEPPVDAGGEDSASDMEVEMDESVKARVNSGPRGRADAPAQSQRSHPPEVDPLDIGGSD